MGKRELVALLSLSSWCLVMVVWLFLAVPWGLSAVVIVVYSLTIFENNHYHFLHALHNCKEVKFEITRSLS